MAIFSRLVCFRGFSSKFVRTFSFRQFIDDHYKEVIIILQTIAAAHKMKGNEQNQIDILTAVNIIARLLAAFDHPKAVCFSWYFIISYTDGYRSSICRERHFHDSFSYIHSCYWPKKVCCEQPKEKCSESNRGIKHHR